MKNVLNYEIVEIRYIEILNFKIIESKLELIE